MVINLLTINEPLEVKRVEDIPKPNSDDVPYAIISHRWVGDELKYEDMLDFTKNEHGSLRDKAESIKKVKGACKAVNGWPRACYSTKKTAVPIAHVWLDTVCIKKSDPAELSESINSMYRWYEKAIVCFVYLHDHIDGDGSAPFSTSTWFTRGWTLQELIAPSALEFYDKNWKYIGDKETLKNKIFQITGIPCDILSWKRDLAETSISHRMSWFSNLGNTKPRTTTKGEDMAYSLMGLFEVYMPTNQGEGKERAFRRLQEEIMKYSDDQTLFAWVDENSNQDMTDSNLSGCGLLAPSAYCFAKSGSYVHEERTRINNPNAEPFSTTNRGLSICVNLFNFKSNIYIASLDFLIDHQHHVGIFLKKISLSAEYYERIYPWKLCQVKANGRGERKRIYVRQRTRKSHGATTGPQS